MYIYRYVYDEIHEFRALELWVEMNVYVPRNFLCNATF